ncbi:MAG: hypothetical protein J07HQX50_00103, partial [Haloquadratum sp. J07HQX50]
REQARKYRRQSARGDRGNAQREHEGEGISLSRTQQCIISDFEMRGSLFRQNGQTQRQLMFEDRAKESLTRYFTNGCFNGS